MGPGRTVSLIITLAVLWLLLSGHFEPLLLFFGLVSVLLVTWLAARMALADYEGHPVHLFWRAAVYWVWLLKEIVVANIDVVRCVLSPRLPISPTVFDVRSTQKTDLGRVMFANSITLTPGTVTLEVEEGSLRVHALTRAAAEGLATGEMDRRVTAVEREE